jgi:hypothetical protein
MKRIIEYSYIPEIMEIIKPYLQCKVSKILFTIAFIVLILAVIIPLGVSKYLAAIKKGIESYDFIIKIGRKKEINPRKQKDIIRIKREKRSKITISFYFY